MDVRQWIEKKKKKAIGEVVPRTYTWSSVVGKRVWGSYIRT